MVFNHNQTGVFSRIIRISLCAFQAWLWTLLLIVTSSWILFLYKLFFFFLFLFGFFVCLWTNIILFTDSRLSFPHQSHCSMPCQQIMFFLPHAFPENRLFDIFNCLKDSKAPRNQVFFQLDLVLMFPKHCYHFRWVIYISLFSLYSTCLVWHGILF